MTESYGAIIGHRVRCVSCCDRNGKVRGGFLHRASHHGTAKYVMYLRRRCEPSGLKAVFAERMRPDVSFAYCSPCPVIPPDDLRITLIPVILPALGYPMFITVLPVCKVRAARIGAGVQWLSGHSVTSA